MSEHDTSNGTPDSEKVGTIMSLDSDAYQKLDSLYNNAVEYLQSTDKIRVMTYPNDRKYHSSCIEEKIQKKINHPEEKVKGWGRGPVWDEDTCEKIRKCNVFPENDRGNLYALHIRLDNIADWKLKYVGVSEELGDRLQEHLVNTNSKWSKLYDVARALQERYRIGYSYVMISRNGLPDHALCLYIEYRFIEWRKKTDQVDKWGHLWNLRKG